MRKLASIQRVLNVRPIEGADKIEVVDVLGWSVVVSKGEFQPGDLCVYFEVDSWLDSSIPAFNKEVFEARYTTWNGKRGMRLKTIKLRKQISQGLVLPLSDFPEFGGGNAIKWNMVVQDGQDVTDILKIEKWEPPEESQSNGPNKVAGAGMFPSFIRKTDQERVQNYINELPKHVSETFEATIKLDGSSMTVYHVGNTSPHYEHIHEDVVARAKKAEKPLTGLSKLVAKVKAVFVKPKPIPKPEFYQGVCSRNIELDVATGGHFGEYVRNHDVLAKLAAYGKNIAVQGELIGPAIQGNYEQVKVNEYYIYDVFDIDAQKYLLPEDARAAVKAIGLKYVPVLNEGETTWGYTKETEDRLVVDKLLAYAEGPGMNKGVKREGVVFKSNQSEFSFKAISNSYLLKKDAK